jgi:hypothetical protein
MNEENKDEFDLNTWLSTFDGCTYEEMSDDDWNDFLNIVIDEEIPEPDCLAHRDDMEEEDYWEEKKYLIGYWDMGNFNEVTARGFTEELAIDSFIANYRSPHGLQPYVARCETYFECENRIQSGDNSLPEDGQVWRHKNFCNAYYEELNN